MNKTKNNQKKTNNHNKNTKKYGYITFIFFSVTHAFIRNFVHLSCALDEPHNVEIYS